MKKAISLGLAICLVVLMFCLGTGTASAEWDTDVAPEITEEVQALFDQALDGLVGVNYTPIAVLGRQEDALCILCKATVVYPGAKPYYALVDISTAADKAGLLNIRVLSIDEAPEVEIDYGTSEIYTREDMDEAIVPNGISLQQIHRILYNQNASEYYSDKPARHDQRNH